MKLPDLGVGLTYSSAIEPILRDSPELVDVIEVEPQTTWIEVPDGNERYRFAPGVLDHLARLPGRKLVHSVGAPVGGTVAPEPEQMALLREAIDHLDAPWASDHLSFNSTPEFRTGFFLPPRQTQQGVDTVVASIRAMQRALPVPFAVENGVSYLRPRNDELTDGAFLRQVAETAECGLLLDLHNAFANAINGRQPLEDFLDELPLERVWELHVAGGVEMEGFWLDAHSGAIPEPLLAAARDLAPALPNLRAIVFEIFPAFIPVVGLDTVRRQIEALRGVWELRGGGAPPAPSYSIRPAVRVLPEGPDPAEWEAAIGALVVGRPAAGPLAAELAADPGVSVVRKLIEEFRASLLVNVLRLTMRFLLLSLGQDGVRIILREFWARTPPRMYAVSEAHEFAAFLESLDLKIPRLYDVLAFERAMLGTVVDERPTLVRFRFDPLPLLRGLAEGRLPDALPTEGDFEIEITPDAPLMAGGVEIAELHQVYPFH